MTVVRVKVQVPADGLPAPAVGFLRWAPTARRVVPAVGSEPAAVVLPTEFRAPLVLGAAEIDVEPTTGAWVWCVTEVFTGTPARRRYFAVPDEESVDYADLIEIDPLSLEPAPSREPAWLATVADLESRMVTVTPDPGNPGLYLIGATQ